MNSLIISRLFKFALKVSISFKFKITKIFLELPIQVKKHKNNEINAKGEELWNNEEIMKSFLRLLHGSFDNKRIIVSDFILRYFLLKNEIF